MVSTITRRKVGWNVVVIIPARSWLRETYPTPAERERSSVHIHENFEVRIVMEETLSVLVLSSSFMFFQFSSLDDLCDCRRRKWP